MKKLVRWVLAVIAIIIALPIGLFGYARLSDYLTDYDAPVVCQLEEYQISLPKGYFRYGPAVNGCHAQTGDLMFDAFLPDVTVNPIQVVGHLNIAEYIPLTVDVSVDIGTHSKGRTPILVSETADAFDAEKAEVQKVQGHEGLYESHKAREDRAFVKNIKHFYYISKSGIVHGMNCGDAVAHEYRTQTDIPHGYSKCGASFVPVPGLRVGYGYRNSSNVPNLAISEQMEKLMIPAIKKTEKGSNP